jgi:alkyldihydroxyacetonephosphate synthase
MRRWNGWGEETINSPLAPAAAAFLRDVIGPGIPTRDATLEEVIAQVPPSRLPTHALISVEPAERVRHARGQSLSDWIALRSGCIDTFPDGVAFPEGESEVRDLITYAREVGAQLIPYGGGTSVVGHVNARPGNRPLLSVDLRRMCLLHDMDETNQRATFGAGVTGLHLEAQLRARGYTLGHFPQSFEYSTLGGWIATRSSGQQSLGYGRIEQLFAGGHLETPSGTFELQPFPASGTGLDLRELVLGSEGRLGILTEATVRVTPLPEQEQFLVVFFPDWEHGIAAVRQMLQSRLPLAMLRLSTPMETKTNLLLAGHERLMRVVEHALALRGFGDTKCMLLMGIGGRKRVATSARKEALHIASRLTGVSMGRILGAGWQKQRFRTPYLRNTLWSMGYAVDTVETAATWDRIPALVEAIETVLRSGLVDDDERVHVFSHLSHVYRDGSGIYTTYLYRIASHPGETLRRWQVLKAAASRAIVAQHGTISHQHGVGTDHRHYLLAEKGALGLAAMRQLYAHFDPEGMMNPGKLIV